VCRSTVKLLDELEFAMYSLSRHRTRAPEDVCYRIKASDVDRRKNGSVLGPFGRETQMSKRCSMNSVRGTEFDGLYDGFMHRYRRLPMFYVLCL